MTEALMQFEEIEDIPGFRLLRSGGADVKAGGFASVSIDSRDIRPGALFVALEGRANDGHRFVEAAFRQGARAALVAAEKLRDPALALEEAAKKAGAVLIVTEHTLRGLQNLAAAYLEKFPALRKIAITGSSGKTTVKEIAAAMFRQETSVICNAGNLNSETGLPLSVFEVRAFHETGIFEAGMNRKGEIAELAAVLKPSISLITNIGPAHIGMIGSIEEIVEEKKQIFSRFTGKETAFVPEDEKYRAELAAGVRGNVVFYGPASLEDLGEVRDRGLDGTEITWEGVPVLFSLPGRHNLRDALAAAAIAKAGGISGDSIRRGLAEARPLFGRSETVRLPCPSGEITVIRDCYNANPESARAAIEFCDDLDWPGRRFYVLGSMLELGAASAGSHAELGRAAAASKADRVFFFGEETEAAFDACRAARAGRGGEGAFFVASMEELFRAVSGSIAAGDLLLLKGSRGCALERLLDYFPVEKNKMAEAFR